MGRRKIGMELIKNKRSRNLTYQKRKKGLEKKADELSTLCQVKLCMIIYRDKHQEEPAIVWPEKDTIQSLIESYRGRSDDDRRLRTHDLSFYFKDLARKVEMESAKLRKMNHEAKYPTWDQLYDNLSNDQLKQLSALLETKIEVIKQRMEFLKGTLTISLEDMHAMSFLEKQVTQPNTPFVIQSLVRKSSLQLEIIEQQQPLVPPMSNFPEINTHVVGPVTELVPFGGHHMMLNNNVENEQGMGMMTRDNILLNNVSVNHHHQYPPPQSLCYFVPMVTPTNYFHHQYPPLLPSVATGSYEMHASQREEYYEMPDHFHTPNTMK